MNSLTDVNLLVTLNQYFSFKRSDSIVIEFDMLGMIWYENEKIK